MTTAATSKPNRSGPIGWLTENTLTGMARRRALMGYLFVLPTILGILIFTAGPVLASFGLSFFKWNVFRPPVYIGLDNYVRMFGDERVAISFWNTARFVVLAISLQIIFALLLALALRQ